MRAAGRRRGGGQRGETRRDGHEFRSVLPIAIRTESLFDLSDQAWLLPVAAQLTGDGRLQVIDRLGAPLLGVVSLAGMLIILRLIDASAKTNQGSTLLRVSQDTVT